MEKGIKHDDGKLQWYDLPLELVELLVPVATAGRKEYGLHSALKPLDNSTERWFSADMRHGVPSQRNPLAKDETDGCYHLAKRAYNNLARLYQALHPEGEEQQESNAVGTEELYAHEVQLETDLKSKQLPPGRIVDIPEDCCGSLCGRQHVD